MFPLTVIILYNAYGIRFYEFGYAFKLIGIPLKKLIDIYVRFRGNITDNEIRILFHPLLVVLYFFLGIAYCLIFKLFMAEWSLKKALHPVAVYGFMPAFSLAYIIGLSLTSNHWVEDYFYYVLWTQFPFYLIYDCMNPFVPVGWHFLIQLTFKMIYFAGLGYVMGFVSMRIYKCILAYIKKPEAHFDAPGG
ncbi:hypothetical protein K8I31_03755 [bacterium]|nr:hypothetical protein [bacterium]